MIEEVFSNVKLVIELGVKLFCEDVDVVVDVMKCWLMDYGVIYYIYWFQLLMGCMVEKYDFFFILCLDGEVVEEFIGDIFVQQEFDGLFFFGGGLWFIFEVCGYMAWDFFLLAFILEVGEGKIFCILIIFVIYGGDFFDYKLLLLKLQFYLEQAVILVCQLFDEQVFKVWVIFGWEQEYFLVDEVLFNVCFDLLLMGCIFLGKYLFKGQQLDDYYFGFILEWVYVYMCDLEMECYKLGILVCICYNEVGFGQYELVLMFEEVNFVVDYNQLLMDLMDCVVCCYKLWVLLYEKFFVGVNGLGKYNNWLMLINMGSNLLLLGKKLGSNLCFLMFFVNIIQAVYKYVDILCVSVVLVFNDYCLGANEVLLVIVFVFIGDIFIKVFDSIENGVILDEVGVKEVIDLLNKILNLELDNIDCNWMFFFVFIGNKFEICMVGFMMNCVVLMMVMNMIVGCQLELFNVELKELMDKGQEWDVVILMILCCYIKELRAICFEGDGYSEVWEWEVEKWGLVNMLNMLDVLNVYKLEEVIELFMLSKVFIEKELYVYYEVMNENYIIKLQIEACIMGEMVINYILFVVIVYQGQLVDGVVKIKEFGLIENEYKVQLDIIKLIVENISFIKQKVNEMMIVCWDVNELEDVNEMVKVYCYEIKLLMEEICIYVDCLEYLVDDWEWLLIKYWELMFVW